MILTSADDPKIRECGGHSHVPCSRRFFHQSSGGQALPADRKPQGYGRYRVSRNAVYDWVRIAELNVEQAFRASTPGKKTATLSEQNQRLQAQLDDVLGRYHKISQSSTGPAVCARCPRCHRTNLLRNGRVRTKRDGLRQRLWCRTCNVSVYVDYVDVKKNR